MGKNYNINRKPISDEEIESYKDFNNVLKKAEQNPDENPPKNRGPLKKFLSVLAVVGAATLLYFLQNKEKAPSFDNSKQVTADSTGLNNPLIAERFDESERFYIHSEADTFVSQYGTSLYIPDQLLDSKEGDSVLIQLSEFHDWGAITMAGIPMTYDSAGTNYAFETGGMIDIRPVGDDCSFNPGKEIEVKMASLTDDPSFNHYQYNSEINNWEYKGKEEIVKEDPQESHEAVSRTFDSKLIEEKKACEKRIIDLRKEIPQPPKKSNTENYSFTLDVDPVEFPELSSFKAMVFEVKPDQSFNSEIYEISWDDIKLTREENKGYTVTLTRTSETRVFQVVPALSGDTFDEAYKDYQKEKILLQKEIELEEKRKELLEKEIHELEEAFNSKYLSSQSDTVINDPEWTNAKSPFIRSIDFARYKKTKDQNKNINAYRVFSVTEFGLYNCDKARKYPNNEVSPVVFRDEDGQSLEVGTFYLADRKKNRAYTFNHELDKNIAFNRRRDNIAWGNTMSGEIFVSKVSDWEKVEANKTIPVKIYKNCNTTLLRDALTKNEEE